MASLPSGVAIVTTRAPDCVPYGLYRRSWGVWTPAEEPGAAESMRPLEVSGRDLRWHGAEM
jgi:hypothetical protein